MFSATPVSVKAVCWAGTIPTGAQGPVAAGARSIRNPSSFEDPSNQNMSIRVGEVTIVPSPVGAAGTAAAAAPENPPSTATIRGRTRRIGPFKWTFSRLQVPVVVLDLSRVFRGN